MNTNASSSRPNRYAFLAWIVIAIACAIRLLHVYFTGRFNPLAADLQLDAATYDRWARALAFGGDPGPTTLMQAPLYPWFLSLIYRLFGPSLAAVRIAQALLGTATCGLIMLCARRLFESPAAAIFAGIFAALYTPLIFYEGMVLPTALIAFLNVLFISIILSEGRPGAPRLLVAGIVLGIAAAANPPTALLGAFALIHLRLAVRVPDGASGREEMATGSSRRWAAGALALSCGVIVAVAPVIVRNAVRTGEFIPLTAGAGINFYHGNNPAANGFYQVPVYQGASLGGTPEEQAVNMARVASSASGRTLSAAEVSHFWLRVSFDFIRDNPRAWGALLWNKFRFFWNAYERANVENFYFHRRFPGVLGLPLLTFGFIAPLGLLGIFLTRSRWRRLSLAYGGVLTYLFVALAFYVLARYRLPAVCFLAMFAGAAIVELYTLARSRRLAKLALSFSALAVLTFFSNMPAAKDTPGGVAASYVRLGNVYLARGDAANAERAYREALDLDARSESAKWGLEAAKGNGGRGGDGRSPQEIR